VTTAATPAAESLWNARRWWWGIILIAATLIAYAPAYRAGFIWDDPDHVVNNASLRTPEGLANIWFQIGVTPQYYPLVFSSFWIEYQIVRPAPGDALDPTVFHVTNVVLHALGALVLWRILLRLRVPGAWLAATVFALHPIHVESVAWITERKNTLSALMYLLSAWAYLRFSPLNHSSGNDQAPRLVRASMASRANDARERRWGWYALSLVFFLAALFSKTVTCSLPAALLLITWWKHGRIRWRDVSPTVPMFIIGLFMGLLTAWFEKTLIWSGPPDPPLTIAQAFGNVLSGQWHGGVSDYHYTLIERCLIAGRVVWFYASTIVWPFDLAFSYETWGIDARSFAQWLYPASAVLLLFVLWALRRRISRGPLTAALYFGGTLFPAMGFFDVFPFRFSFVADHFQHLASIGLTTLLCAASVTLANRMTATTSPLRTIAAAIGATVVLLLGALTWAQATTYQSEETIWRDTIEKNPRSWLAQVNLAVLLYNRGLDEQRAIAEPESTIDRIAAGERMRAFFEESLSLSRTSLAIKPDLALALVNIGNVRMAQGDRDAAEAEYRAALAIPSNSLDISQFNAHNNLANLLAESGRADEAREHFEIAVAGNPRNATYRMGYGLLLARSGDLIGAMEQYRAALRLDSSQAGPLLTIAANLALAGKPAAALAHCDLVLEYRPEWREARLLRERIIARLSPDGASQPASGGSTR